MTSKYYDVDSNILISRIFLRVTKNDGDNSTFLGRSFPFFFDFFDLREMEYRSSVQVITTRGEMMTHEEIIVLSLHTATFHSLQRGISPPTKTSPPPSLASQPFLRNPHPTAIRYFFTK